MSITNRLCRLLIALAAFITGCVDKPQQQIIPKPVTGLESFDISDAERKKLIAEASTNSYSAFRLFQYYQFVHYDNDAAMKWLRKSAQGGDPVAQYNLGLNLKHRRGYIDLDESKTWFLRSAAQGNEDAKKMLSDWSQ